MTAFRFLLARLSWLWRYGLSLACWMLIIITFLPRASIPTGDRALLIAYTVSPYAFDYIGWEIQAILAKAGQTLFGQHPFMTEDARTAFVRAYVADLAETQALEARISAAYTDPNIADPAQVTAQWRAERDARRADLHTRQTTFEAILEGQVAAVLIDEGFGWVGQLLPPMAMRFSAVPNLLIVSPLDRIELAQSINVLPLPVDRISEIETHIDTSYEVSSLIVPLGGIALYPAMILETTSIPFIVETFAHEWLHHYLFAFPLGLGYFTGGGGQTRTINETTADLFGKEVARRVLARYYPDLLPSAPSASPPSPPSATAASAPPVFDFAVAMNETRITVDELLAEGRIADVEPYLAERRQLFFENGYRFRKINQAFFAFYGGYQGGAVPGIGGEDPIGPAVRAIREASPDLLTFIRVMRDIVTREQLISRAEEIMLQ